MALYLAKGFKPAFFLGAAPLGSWTVHRADQSCRSLVPSVVRVAKIAAGNALFLTFE